VRASALALGFVLAVLGTIPAAGQDPQLPDTVAIQSGGLILRALLWTPRGSGPFPAVLFNHGSYGSTDTVTTSEPAALGRVFARHGYAFLFLFRRGVGLSAGQGAPEGDLMDRAFVAHGLEGRNGVQLELLETEALNEALAGVAFLRARPQVDAHRVAVVGHSFGGALSLLLAAHDTTLRAAVVFGAAAASWVRSPELQRRLLAAVRPDGPSLPSPCGERLLHRAREGAGGRAAAGRAPWPPDDLSTGRADRSRGTQPGLPESADVGGGGLQLSGRTRAGLNLRPEHARLCRSCRSERDAVADRLPLETAANGSP